MVKIFKDIIETCISNHWKDYVRNISKGQGFKGAELILQLRSLWKDNEWNRFWQNRKKAVKMAA